MILESSEGARLAEATDEPTPRHPDEGRPFSLRERLLRPQTLISFALALALVIFAARGLRIDIAATLSYMGQANPWLLLAALGAFYATFPIRALRWRLMLSTTGTPVAEGRTSWASLGAMQEYLYLGWFANCIVPAKLGDAYRGYLLKRNGGVPFSTAIGTIFAERLLDVLGLFSMLLLAAWLTFGAQIPDGTQIVFGFGAVLAVVIVAGLGGMHYLGAPIRALIPRRLHEFYGRFEHAALHSFSPAILPRLIILTGLVWLLEGLRLFFVIQALAGQTTATLPLAAILFVALTSSLLTAVPFTPAGLGVVESVTTVVLTLLGINQNLGVAVTLLDRLINYWSVVAGGLLVYLFSKRK